MSEALWMTLHDALNAIVYSVTFGFGGFLAWVLWAASKVSRPPIGARHMAGVPRHSGKRWLA